MPIRPRAPSAAKIGRSLTLHHSVLSLASPWSGNPSLDLDEEAKMDLGIWCKLGTQALVAAPQEAPFPGASSPLNPLPKVDYNERLQRAARAATMAESSPAVRMMATSRDLQDLVRRWNALSAHSPSRYHSSLSLVSKDVLRVHINSNDIRFNSGATAFLGHIIALLVERMGGNAETTFVTQRDRFFADVIILNDPSKSVTLPLLNRLDTSDPMVRLSSRVMQTLDDPWPLKKASTFLNISERSVQRRLMGHRLSWPLLLRAVRLHAAMDSVIDSKESMTSIAHRCGFADSAHFSRWFKQAASLPPQVYRSLSQGGKE